MKFLCLGYGDEKAWNDLPKVKQDELLAQDKRLRERGDLVEALSPATTVRAWTGTPSTAAGPFSEPKLPLAGFALIEARDLAEAVQLVAKTPCAVAKGAVEIWPVRDLGRE
jgi:hypothetical protein